MRRYINCKERLKQKGSLGKSYRAIYIIKWRLAIV
nr:MAG TPA: hypothetical protein [Caudoviricetes sp.]